MMIAYDLRLQLAGRHDVTHEGRRYLMTGAHGTHREHAGRVKTIHRHQHARHQAGRSVAYEYPMMLGKAPTLDTLPVLVIDLISV